MGPSTPKWEQELAVAVTEAAALAEHLAEHKGSCIEASALALYGTLLSLAECTMSALSSADGTDDRAVGAALLASAILQLRAALASLQVTAEALIAARRRGREEGREEGFAAGLRAAARGQRRILPPRRPPGDSPLSAVS